MSFFREFLKKPQKIWFILLHFLQNKLYFLRFFEESSKILKIVDLSLNSKLEVFWGFTQMNLKDFGDPHPQKSSKNYKRQTSTSKNLKIWGWGWGSSNFEVTDANPTAAPTAWTQIKHTIFFAQIVTLIWNDLTVSKHSWQTEITSSGEENYLWIEPKEMDVNWISLKSEISSLKIDFINGIILWNQYLQ